MSKDVKLNIMTQSNNGFSSATGSKGSTFYYKYTGGNLANGSRNGNNHFFFDDQPTAVTFTVTFVGNDGQTYKFPSSAFVAKPVTIPPTLSDLSGTNTDSCVTVTDSGENDGSFSYGVTVEVITGAETFQCDPTVTNSRNSMLKK
jgi:hypothetical protein